jgi:hypothetical protein
MFHPVLFPRDFAPNMVRSLIVLAGLSATFGCAPSQIDGADPASRVSAMAHADQPIDPTAVNWTLGELIVYEPSAISIAFELPVHGALPEGFRVRCEYRASGSPAWRAGPSLKQVRDQYAEVPRGQVFVGMLWGLAPGTSYEVRLSAVAPGGVTDSVSTLIATRALAPETSDRPATVTFEPGAKQSMVQAVFSKAKPGDIFEFIGEHALSGLMLPLGVNGTADEPIYIRGIDGATIGGPTVKGPVFTVRGSNWVIEDLVITGATAPKNYAIKLEGWKAGVDPQRAPIDGFTLRRSIITGRRGIKLVSGYDTDVRGVACYDNRMRGPHSWADIISYREAGKISQTWDDTGIEISGPGHSIFNNTLSGYGDSFKVSRFTSSAARNENISIYRNKVLWGGDDGVELDDVYSAGAAVENLVLNTATGISFQPNTDTGGPKFAVRNVIVNSFARFIKCNDSPSGLVIVHNTIVYAVPWTAQPVNYGWFQHNNGGIDNMDFLNNLIVGTNLDDMDGHIRVDAPMHSVQWDGNAYFPNDRIETSSYGMGNSLGSAKWNVRLDGYDGAEFEASGIALRSQPFRAGIDRVGVDWRYRVTEFDPTLDPSTPAASGAIALDGYGGDHSSPSRGAVQHGEAAPQYGARVRSDIDAVI